jgi:aminoglycoside phosphotransferase family enzyme
MSAASNEINLRQTLSFLSDPASYTDNPETVECVETRMSWVFLTTHYVYKMKKPVVLPYLDFTTLDKRRANCVEEVRLNRRLAREVYLDVLAVTRERDGQLVFDGDGEPVEWLVWMRRLPREQMLDQALGGDRADPHDLRHCARVLVDFYRTCSPAILDPDTYVEKLYQAIDEDLHGLAHPSCTLDPAVFQKPADILLDCLNHRRDWFEARVNQGYIIEAHGDLRPEHVCLSRPPVFIDCLEFSRELRTLDVADELGYLFLECECLGAPEVERIMADEYVTYSGNPLPGGFLAFYKSRRALLRARLCLAHLGGNLPDETEKRWRDRAGDYLQRAEHHANSARDFALTTPSDQDQG